MNYSQIIITNQLNKVLKNSELILHVENSMKV